MCRSSFVACRLLSLVVCCLLIDVCLSLCGCRSLMLAVGRCSLFVVRCLMFVVCWWSLFVAVRCRASSCAAGVILGCWLCGVCCSLFAIR